MTGKGRRNLRKPLLFDRFCLSHPFPAKPYPLTATPDCAVRGQIGVHLGNGKYPTTSLFFYTDYYLLSVMNGISPVPA